MTRCTVLPEGPIFVGTVKSPDVLSDPKNYSNTNDDETEPESGSLMEEDPDYEDLF